MSEKTIRKLVIIIICLVIVFTTIIVINKKLNNISDSQYGYLEKNQEIYLKINQDSVTNTSLNFKIYNNTNQELYYGVNYEIEFYKNDKWQKYNVISSWIDLAVILKPNSINAEKAEWESIYGKLSKGKYRIIKNINNTIVFDEFEIK